MSAPLRARFRRSHHRRAPADPGAGAGAQQTLDAEIARRGVTGIRYQIEVSEWGGEEFPGFPPVPRADLWNADSWAVKEPSVGVYVEVAVPTFLLDLLQVNPVHRARLCRGGRGSTLGGVNEVQPVG